MLQNFYTDSLRPLQVKIKVLIRVLGKKNKLKFCDVNNLFCAYWLT
jgi:hypothetical protein